MIHKKLEDITLEDIQALKDNQVSESKTIEYKREIIKNAASDKVPFLKGISAFANTSGGDFIIGVEEKSGIPIEINGIQLSDTDAELRRLESIIRDTIEPSLTSIDMKHIRVKDDNYVIVIRVQQSWNPPHRVKENSKFYGRNSAGKYELDVSELRLAFTLSEQISEKMRNFRIDRITKVYADETPVALRKGGKLLLHVIPLSAFTTHNGIDVNRCYQTEHSFPPIAASG